MEDKVEEVEFCTELRTKTQAIHDKSDKLINLKLAVVLTDTTLYGNVLADFYYVFQTIEDCVSRSSQHKHIGTLQVSGLERTDAFEEDLEFYLGPNWKGRCEPSEPAKEYCDRILKVTEEDATLLVAYVHSMYLALIAGGQILKRIIRKTLGLSGHEGLAIFHFEGSEDSRLQLKNKLKESINELDLEPDEKEKILEEKRRCFAMNNAIANNVKPSIKSFSRLIKIFLFILIILIAIGNVIMMFVI